MYAIYLQHQPKDNPLEAVLLTDGAFTCETNCYMREYGIVWHKPKLFPTKGGAKNYAHREGFDQNPARYKIRKYTGPIEPWDRALLARLSTRPDRS